MAADRADASDGEFLDVWLPSGRWIALRAMDTPGADTRTDDDMGVVEDVRARGLDFTAATAILREVSDLVKSALRPLRPREAEVEIGLMLSAKTARVLVVFGEAAAQASIKVTLKWSFDDEDGGAEEGEGEADHGSQA